MPQLGAPELIVVLFILLIIFGAGKLTDVGRSLGQGIREFRHSVNDEPAPATPAGSTPVGSTPVGSAPAATVVANKCTRCGAELQPGARFCASCGQAVTS
jgi:sec-independent protein translocase protein TatA